MKKIEQAISSLEVSEMVGKRHTDLIRDVRRYIDQFNERNIASVDFFTESTYKDGKGEERPCYQVTKKGCEFIAHKLTGVKGAEFTARYINRFHEMEAVIQHGKSSFSFEELSPELQAILMHDEKIVKIDGRVTDLENNMVIDYGQQQTLKNEVNKVVVKALGGKESNAYKEVSKKVFSEINHDIQEKFTVNSRNNVPKKRFDEVIAFIRSWSPSQGTKWMIDGCNAQMSL